MAEEVHRLDAFVLHCGNDMSPANFVAKQNAAAERGDLVNLRIVSYELFPSYVMFKPDKMSKAAQRDDLVKPVKT